MLIYTDLVSEIIHDIAAKVPAFAHLDPAAIALATAPRWARKGCGHLAQCVGLADRDRPSFSIWVARRSRRVSDVSRWFIHRAVEVSRNGNPCNYLILLHLPRMLQSDPTETIVHELFHIGLEFDGHLRAMRHGKTFDRYVRKYMAEWRVAGDPELVRLAACNLEELEEEFGSVLARRMPKGFRTDITEYCDAPCPYEDAFAQFYPRHRLEPGFKVRDIKMTSEKAPRKIEIEDCPVYRYGASGASPLPKSLARYVPSRRTFAGTCDVPAPELPLFESSLAEGASA